jgi:alkylhydroperoxidase family enzyme
VEGLHEEGVSQEDILAVQGNLTDLGLSKQTQALLILAEGVTLEPATAAEWVNPALEAGCSEEEIAHAIFIVSYFNMVTRIAEAFALPPDQSHPFDPSAPLPLAECGP